MCIFSSYLKYQRDSIYHSKYYLTIEQTFRCAVSSVQFISFYLQRIQQVGYATYACLHLPSAVCCMWQLRVAFVKLLWQVIKTKRLQF